MTCSGACSGARSGCIADTRVSATCSTICSARSPRLTASTRRSETLATEPSRSGASAWWARGRSPAPRFLEPAPGSLSHCAAQKRRAQVDGEAAASSYGSGLTSHSSPNIANAKSPALPSACLIPCSAAAGADTNVPAADQVDVPLGHLPLLPSVSVGTLFPIPRCVESGAAVS
jgi:hypothetical protein